MQNWKNKIVATINSPTDNPKHRLHVIKIDLIEELGFHAAYQFWLKTISDLSLTQSPISVYVNSQKVNYDHFCQQESFLLQATQNKDIASIENWIRTQAQQFQLSKAAIYQVLLCLHLFLNWTEKYGEVYADWLADCILDRFGSWGKTNPILPD